MPGAVDLAVIARGVEEERDRDGGERRERMPANGRPE
jgi:hypothetical protein